MRWCSVAAIAPAVAGCSLIYNPNNLPDPRSIDAAIVDSNPCALMIDGITPSVIDEGQGDLGSAPALLVVHGNNIVSTDLQVELRPPAGKTVHLGPISDLAASHDTTYLAFTVAAMVDGQLEVDVPLDVIVTQGGSAAGTCTHQATLTGQLTLRGRKELTSVTDYTSIDPMYAYSQVDLPAPPVAMGGPALTIRAVSSISIGTLTAKASGMTAGPGGFDGGGGPGNGPGAGGVGGPVSGAGLGSGGGGGGAGYAGDGKAGMRGSGANGGTAGSLGLACGDDELLGPNNRASSGGAGGSGGLLAINAGGVGGGGGGTVTLIAGGNLSVDAVIATGGDGTAAKGAGGDGGGGAGGTVLLRTLHGTLRAPMIQVAGGKGTGTSAANGGAGAAGRVRWDAPGDTAPGADAPTVRGPSLVVPTRIFTAASPQINVKGPGNRGFIVRVIDQDNMPHDSGLESFNAAGTTMIAPALSGGRNQVCVILDGGPQTTVADQCIDVAYLP